MKRKVYKTIAIIIIITTLFSTFSGCAKKKTLPQMTLQGALQPFMKALEDGDLTGMTLKIYAADPDILVRGSYTVERLIEAAKIGTIAKECTIDTEVLKQYIALLQQVQPENFELVDAEVHMHITLCLILETENAMLTIAGYGWGVDSYSDTIFLNGIAVKRNSIIDEIFALCPPYKAM